MSWQTVRLGDVISTLKGFAFKSSHYTESGHPIVRASNFTMDSISDDDLKYYSYEEALQYKKYSLKKSDVLIQTVGSWEYNPNSVVGKVVRVPEQLEGALLNQNIVKIMPNDAVDNIFLYYRLKCDDFSKYNIGNAVGAANQASITLDTIRDFTFECPEIIVQKRIANILSAYDDLIENNQKQIKLLEEAAQRLYKEWFVDLRFPGYENTPIIDGVPQGWRITEIGNYFKTLLGGTPSREKAEYWENGTIPWINSGKVNELRVVEPSEYITDIALQRSATKLLPKHTTLVAITGATLGQVSYTEIETCANQSVVGIVDESQQYSEYVYCYILNNIKNIIGKATGGAQQHINKDIVNSYQIVLPSDDIAVKFQSVAKPIFDKISMLLFENINLTEARDRLLPKLMSGELEV